MFVLSSPSFTVRDIQCESHRAVTDPGFCTWDVVGRYVHEAAEDVRKRFC